MGGKRLNLVDYPADCCRIRPLERPSANSLRNPFKIDPTGATMKSRSIPAFSLTARFSQTILVLVLCFLPFSAVHAQTPVHYEPTLESLNQHPLPEWYAGAKLGIFIHWGLYSVPGWAPLVHPEHDFESVDYIAHNPYAEWYLNSMRLEGSPTQAYHKEHYGAGHDYYNFAPVFNREIH